MADRLNPVDVDLLLAATQDLLGSLQNAVAEAANVAGVLAALQTENDTSKGATVERAG